MPWALIALFALLGWALFGWQLYRAGKRKRDLTESQAAYSALQRVLENERKVIDAQLELFKNTGRVDADSLNGAVDRLRSQGKDTR
jgi:predicted negative regulator of RcsB-dependent stress response